MERSSPSHRQGVFPLMLLPLEIRQKIYTYAVISVPLIELRVNYHGGAGNNTSLPGRARLYTTQDFRMLATNREFRKEMSDAKNAFEIPLWQDEPRQGICLHQIDLVRIRKCRLFLHNMDSMRHKPNVNLCDGSYPLYCHHRLRALAATLAFNKEYTMKAVLVECQHQNSEWLLEWLRPMAMLRQVDSICFHSHCPDIQPYFRFLEALIASDRDVPFRSWQEFGSQTQPWIPRRSDLGARRGMNGPPPRSTDMTGEVIVKSRKEMNAMTRNLYAILEIDGMARRTPWGTLIVWLPHPMSVTDSSWHRLHKVTYSTLFSTLHSKIKYFLMHMRPLLHSYSKMSQIY